MAPLLVLFPLVAYPFPSATPEAVVDGSTERVRRLYPISTPKDDTSASRADSRKVDIPVFDVCAHEFHAQAVSDVQAIRTHVPLSDAPVTIASNRSPIRR